MLEDIIVSLVTSVITWTLLLIGQKVLLPYYESLVYKGVVIKGLWNHVSKMQDEEFEEVTFTETLTINQKAHLITGTYSVTNITEGKNNMTSVYTINGKIINNHVYLTADIQNNNQIGLATFLLTVNAGGRVLVGSVSVLNRAGEGILTFENIEYTRD